MKINWKLRFGNKVTLTTLIAAVAAFIYQALGMIGIVPTISQSEVMVVALMLVNILGILGIVTDPTTEGISDSERALTYDEPK